MGPKGIYISNEEIAFSAFIVEMADCGLLLTSTQVKLKVEQITQKKITPFKNGVLEPFLMY